MRMENKMMKLVYGIVFLMITIFHVNASSYLEDNKWVKSNRVYKLAKDNLSPTAKAEDIYANIYTEARKYVPLKGTDSESLFLDLYFSACFLANHDNKWSPENLTDELYSSMLAPLGGAQQTRLSALELTGILSRVSGVFFKESFRGSDDCQNAFARLITGKGRFKLEESSEERRRQFIIDIYRNYNVTDVMFGRVSKRGDAQPNMDILFKEIVGDISDTVHLGHRLSCFAVAYLANNSSDYRLSSEYEILRVGLLEYFSGKFGRDISVYETTLRKQFRYLYDVVSGQIMAGQYVSDMSKREILDAFYGKNLQQDATKNARLSQQINIGKTPSMAGDFIPSLKDAIGKVPFSEGKKKIFLAESLGSLSFQMSLTSYGDWEEMMTSFLGRAGWNGIQGTLPLWSDLNDALSDNPLRKSLFSFLKGKIKEDKVAYPKQEKDPRYVSEKTQKELEKEKVQTQKLKEKTKIKETKTLEEIVGLARSKNYLVRIPLLATPSAMTAELKSDWNTFIDLGCLLKYVKENAEFKDSKSDEEEKQYFELEVVSKLIPHIRATRFKMVETSNSINFINMAEFSKAYKKLALAFHPDKLPTNDKIYYKSHFKFLGNFKDEMTRFFPGISWE